MRGKFSTPPNRAEAHHRHAGDATNPPLALENTRSTAYGAWKLQSGLRDGWCAARVALAPDAVDEVERMIKRWDIQYIAAFAVAIFAASVLYLSAGTLDVDVQILTRDPYKSAGVQLYYGIFSLLGSVIWLISSTVAVTTAVVARRRFHSRLSDVSTFRILALGGALGFILALDDVLPIHEAFVDLVGIPALFLPGIFLSLGLAVIAYSRAIFRWTPWRILAVSFLCLCLSIGIDLADDRFSRLAALDQSQDAFKFCGIVLWAFYFLATARRFVADFGSDVPSTDRSS
jgi:hypothetical protein